MKFTTFKAIISTIAYPGAVIASTIVAKKTSDTSWVMSCIGFVLLYAFVWCLVNWEFMDEMQDKVIKWRVQSEGRWDERVQAQKKTN